MDPTWQVHPVQRGDQRTAAHHDGPGHDRRACHRHLARGRVRRRDRVAGSAAGSAAGSVDQFAVRAIIYLPGSYSLRPLADNARLLTNAEMLFTWVEHVVEHVTTCLALALDVALRPPPIGPCTAATSRAGSIPSCSTDGPAYPCSLQSSGCCSSS